MKMQVRLSGFSLKSNLFCLQIPLLLSCSLWVERWILCHLGSKMQE
ncbi:hypothetical protein Gotur_031621 [Gossypium turneri]